MKLHITALFMLGLGITAWAQDTINVVAKDTTKIVTTATNIANDTNKIATIAIDSISTLDSTQTIKDSIVSENDTIKVRVVDVIENYDLPKEYYTDSTAFENYLKAQPQEFVTLRDYSQKIATKARSMVADLDLDYHNGLIWLDKQTCIADYDSGRVVLQKLVSKADSMNRHYDNLEKERIETERRLAEERAREEARKIQEAKNAELASLHESIANHHRNIDSKCNSEVSNKAQQKTLKDLFYAYLAVYNKYDITSTTADDRLLSENGDLNAFQQHLLDSLLSENSYYNQISSFRDRLKAEAGHDYSFVYKSYSKLFKRISVAINFSTIEEYNQYIDNLVEVRNTQELYKKSVVELKQIATMSDSIVEYYGKKYRDEANAYKTMVSNQDFTPTFITSENGEKFIGRLDEFKQVQQRYLDNYNEFEEIAKHSETIIEKSKKRFSDIATAYKTLLSKTSFVTSFSTLVEADEFGEKITNFKSMQDLYDQIIYLRIAFMVNDDSILHAKSINKSIANGYKEIKKTCKLTPNFVSVEQGKSFIKLMESHITLQNLFIAALQDNKQIKENIEKINNISKPYKNINKAYKRVVKAYTINKSIVSQQDLEIAIKMQRQHLELQNAFIDASNSADVESINLQMKNVKDMDTIKLILKMK